MSNPPHLQESDSHRYEVWRTTTGGMTRHSKHRFRWVARLVAWEHTNRGWFKYEVRER